MQKRFEIKCSLEVVVVEQMHAKLNKFQTISKNIIPTVNVQKTHSPKMSFSTKTFSTVNETRPDMMASCSFQKTPKNNDLYLVRRRDLAKTNLITSASYLDTNSRVKCSMHSSPNIVTAHRVYPYTFIQNARADRDKQHKEAPNKTRKSPANKKGGKPTTPNRTEGSEAGRTNQGRKRARGEEGKRRPAETEREDAREGSRGREKTAQAKKAGACSVSGVLRGFWITQGRIP